MPEGLKMPGGVLGKSPSEYKHYAEKNPEAFRRFVSKNLPMERRRTPSRATVRRSFSEKYQEGA
jgi:hypothetical protein